MQTTSNHNHKCLFLQVSIFYVNGVFVRLSVPVGPPVKYYSIKTSFHRKFISLELIQTLFKNSCI